MPEKVVEIDNAVAGNHPAADKPGAAGVSEVCPVHYTDTAIRMICAEMQESDRTLKSANTEYSEKKKTIEPDFPTAVGAMKTENETKIKPTRATIAVSVLGNDDFSKLHNNNRNKTNKEPKYSPSSVIYCTKTKKSKRCKRKASATSLNTSPRNVCKEDLQEKKRRKISHIGTILRKVKTKIFRRKTRQHKQNNKQQTVGCNADRDREVRDNTTKERNEVITRSQSRIKSNGKCVQEKKGQSENAFDREQDNIDSKIDDTPCYIDVTMTGSTTVLEKSDTTKVPDVNNPQTVCNIQNIDEPVSVNIDQICVGQQVCDDNREKMGTETRTENDTEETATEARTCLDRTDTTIVPDHNFPQIVCNVQNIDESVSVNIDKMHVDPKVCEENEKKIGTEMPKVKEIEETASEARTVLVQNETIDPENNLPQIICNKLNIVEPVLVNINNICVGPWVCEDNQKKIGTETHTEYIEESNESNQRKNHNKIISDKSDICFSNGKMEDDVIKHQIKLKRQLMCDIMNSGIVRLKRGQRFDEKSATRINLNEKDEPVEVAGDDFISLKTTEVGDIAEFVIDISNLLPDDVVKIVSKLREEVEHDESHVSYPEYEFLGGSEMEIRLETIKMHANVGGRKAYHELVKLATEQKTGVALKVQNLQTSTLNTNTGIEGGDQMVYYRANDIIKLARRMHYGGYKGKRYMSYLQEKEKKEKEEHLKSHIDENLDVVSESFTDCSEFSENDIESMNHNENKSKETAYGKDIVQSDTDTLSSDTESDYQTCDDDTYSYSDEDKEQTLQTKGDLRPEKRKTMAEILVEYWNYDDKRERIIAKEWVRWERSGTGFVVQPKLKRKENLEMDPLERKIKKNRNKKSFFLGRWRLNRSQNAAIIDRAPSEEDQTDWEMLKQVLLADEVSLKESNHTSHEETPLWQRKRIRHIPTLY